MDAQDYFDLGVQYADNNDYGKALEAFENAKVLFEEKDLPALEYNIALCHNNLGDVAKAIIAFSNTEKYSGDRYPAASYNLGLNYFHGSHYDEAILAFNRAEISNGGQFPLASYNKGICYYNKENYAAAIIAYAKAEFDSGGKYPSASYNKGKCYLKLGDIDSEIAAYKKAERDNGGRLPDATCDVGICLAIKGDYKNAISACVKAIRDSGGSFPRSSYHQGIIYQKIGAFRQAIECFTKAEHDSGGSYPDASLRKGEIYFNIYRFEEALESFIKAERDNGGNFPLATCNIGACYAKLSNYDGALIALTKAEQDGCGKFPLASINKGQIYWGHQQIGRAIESYLKTISDSAVPDEICAKAHLALAEIYRETDQSLAKLHVFKAMKVDSKDRAVVSMIVEHFSDSYTKRIYEQRLAYLDEVFWRSIQKVGVDHSASVASDGWAAPAERMLKAKTESQNDIDVFIALAANKEVQLPNISFRDRLRLCYLLHYVKGRYGQAFYIIDWLLDDEELFPDGLDDFDRYFHFTTALMIGAPEDELRYHASNFSDKDNAFTIAHRDMAEDLLRFIDEGRMADPYLCDYRIPPFDIDLNGITLHPWNRSALEQLKNPDPHFAPFIGRAEMIGLVSGLLASQANIAVDHKEVDKKSYKNFMNALHNIDGDPGQVISCVTDAMKDRIPARVLILALMKQYADVTDDETRRKIAVAEATVMMSHYIYFRNTSLVKASRVEIPIHCLAEVFVSTPLASLLEAGVLVDLGISASIILLLRGSFWAIEKTQEKQKERAFQWLADEIMGSTN